MVRRKHYYWVSLEDSKTGRCISDQVGAWSMEAAFSICLKRYPDYTVYNISDIK